MGPSGQVVVGQGVKSLLSSEQADFSLLEDIYTCEESSFGPFGFEHCDGALSTAEVTCGSEGKALSDLQMIIEGLDMSIEHYNLAFTPLSSSTEINISGEKRKKKTFRGSNYDCSTFLFGWIPSGQYYCDDFASFQFNKLFLCTV